MKNAEIVIKWVTAAYNGKERPIAYYFKNGKVRRQLRLSDIELAVSEKVIVDPKVIAWLKEKKEIELQRKKQHEIRREVSNDMHALEVMTTNPADGYAPGSRELYEYLESIYGKVRPIGSGFGAYIVKERGYQG